MKIKLLLIAIMTTSFGWSQCNINDATDCVCKDSNEIDCDLLPDIQASWYGILTYSNGPSEYPQEGAGENNGRLRISVSTPNTGYGPLTVRGVDDNGYAYFVCDNDTIAVQTGGSIGGYYCDDSDEPAKHLAIQRIYHRNADGSMGYWDRFAGTMTYHPTHGHMHSDEWGVFTLRKQDPNDPNPLNWPIVSNGAKMGFCLMDYNDCGDDAAYGHCRDENRYSDQYLEDYPEIAEQGFDGGNILTENSQFPNNGLGGQNYGCSVIEQGITVGWTDIYSEYLDDQWIDIDPSLCNGEYWIVGEIDRNNFYLESNKENNWTAVPITLTQQLDSQNFEVEVIPSSTPILCEGETITLTSSVENSTMEYLWSNGMTTSSIVVNEPGTYYVEVTSECGSNTSEAIEVTTTAVLSPDSDNVTVEEGESAILNATGSGNIFWIDNNGELVGTGENFTTPELYEDTSYFIYQEQEIIPAPEYLNTGEADHLCDGGGSCDYSGNIYNGGLRFEAINDFTLNSVKVYAGLAGTRTFELRNTSLDIIFESTTLNIPESEDNGFEVILDWLVPAGEYIITTNSDLNNQNFDGNNPLLKRTTGGLASFPHTIDDIVNISEGYYNNEGDNINGAGFSTSYYYYFYDWKINNDWGIGEVSCISEQTEVEVFVNINNTNIIEENSIDFSIFPNPASKQLSLKPESNFNEEVSIFILNEVGEEIEKFNIEKFTNELKFDIEKYSSGLYFVKIESLKGSMTKPIMFNK
tara:strand:+ start:15661 stop:17907 length:2247 start_codon:yes stop_codon:yes gene_type:complete